MVKDIAMGALTHEAVNGQVWFHHTGHDESRSYGSKAREWQMDCVAIMEKVHDPDSDLAFSLSSPRHASGLQKSRGLQAHDNASRVIGGDMRLRTRRPSPPGKLTWRLTSSRKR